MGENKFSWKVGVTKSFISEYEGNELLYQSGHSVYNNRNNRLEDTRE